MDFLLTPWLRSGARGTESPCSSGTHGLPQFDAALLKKVMKGGFVRPCRSGLGPDRVGPDRIPLVDPRDAGDDDPAGVTSR